MTGPFAQGAPFYRIGWLGLFPLRGKKENIPTGITGRSGAWPTDAQITEWIAQRGGDNIAIRLPDDVIGIDVDAYDGRRGIETITWFESQYGELPRTWRSTSRDDGSGILLYHVPSGLNWVSHLGKDSNVEVIRHAHRYAVVWPSIHPETKKRYRWYAPGGAPQDRPPQPDELTELPDTWIKALQDTRRESNGSGRPIDPSDRVDPIRVLQGLPIGEQETGLFAYIASLRARNIDYNEAKILALAAGQQFANEPGREAWTPTEIITKVDHVWRTYSAGTTQRGIDVSNELRDWAATVGQSTHVDLPHDGNDNDDNNDPHNDEIGRAHV